MHGTNIKLKQVMLFLWLLGQLMMMEAQMITEAWLNNLFFYFRSPEETLIALTIVLRSSCRSDVHCTHVDWWLLYRLHVLESQS
jgi:hypothetical protein